MNAYRLVIHDSVAGGMCFRYGDEFAALYPNADASTERRWPLQKLTTGAVTAAFTFDEVTEFRLFVIVFSRLILDSIDDGMYCGYAASFASVDDRTRRAGRSRVSRPRFDEVTEFSSGLSEFSAWFQVTCTSS
jgi:hypothetical protein